MAVEPVLEALRGGVPKEPGQVEAMTRVGAVA